MKALGRLALILVLLFAALFFYSMGMKSGAFLLILLGLLCEAGFWLGIFFHLSETKRIHSKAPFPISQCGVKYDSE